MTSSSQFKQRKNLPCEVQRFRFQCFINLYFTSIGHAGPTRNTGDAGRQGGPRCSAHLSPTVALSKHTLKAWENEPCVSDLGGKARPCRDRRAMASQGPFAGVRGGAQLPAGGQAASQGHGALAGACPRRVPVLVRAPTESSIHHEVPANISSARTAYKGFFSTRA